MSFIHIKKIHKEDPQGNMRELFAVPSVALSTPQGRKLIPNPAGNEANLFSTLEEAEEAIRRAGFDYIYEGKKTYTLSQPNQPANSAIANVGHPLDQAVPLLIKHLQDREPSVVANSAFALGALKAYPAMDALTAILGHDDATVRKQTAEALARMGPGAMPALRDAFLEAQNSKTKNAPYIRLTIMTAFLEMVLSAPGMPLVEQILPLAVTALEDDSWLVRAQAALVVGHAAQAQEQARMEENSSRDRLRQRPQ
jgi:HEAT repeat protein